MKILVTGAGGQLGREWLDFLDKRGKDFIGFRSAQLDITNRDLLEEKIAYHRPGVLINCAAYTQVDNAEDDSIRAFSVNHEAVKHLSALCKKYSVKLVHFSTDYVFSGDIEDKKRFKNGYPEDHRKDPVNTYGESKLLGENEIKRSGCDYLILRISWLCGKYGKNFVKTMVTLAHQGKFLSVVDDQFGSPTFAHDLVNNTYTLLNQGQRGIYHYTSTGMLTWYQLAKKAIEIAGYKTSIKPVPTSEYPTRALRPAFSKLDTSKIASVHGVNLPSWEDGLKKLIEEFDI